MNLSQLAERIKAMPAWAKIGLGAAVLLVAFLGLRALSSRRASASARSSSGGSRLGGLPIAGGGASGGSGGSAGGGSSGGDTGGTGGLLKKPNIDPTGGGGSTAGDGGGNAGPSGGSPAPRYITVTPWPGQDSTLSGIAGHYNVHGGWQAIWALNPWIKDPNLIHEGDQIRIG